MALSEELFVLTLVGLGLVAVWALLRRRNDKVFTFLFIPFVLWLAVSSHFSLRAWKGYPTREPLPEEFVLLSYRVKEPEKIWLWVYEPKRERPRAYVRPYNREQHRRLGQVRKLLQAGIPILGSQSKGRDMQEERLYNFSPARLPEK